MSIDKEMIMKYIIAMLILTASVFAQGTTYIDGTDCKCDSVVITYEAQEARTLVEDKVEDAYMPDDVLREIPFKNGKVHGVWKRYYETTGYVEREILYVMGKSQSSKDYDYYDSGALVSVYEEKGEKGIRKIYYKSGALGTETPFMKGTANGLAKSYYESGKLYTTEVYVGGELHGVRNTYFESGPRMSTETYKNGELVGYKQCYTEQGKKGKFGNSFLNCFFDD